MTDVLVGNCMPVIEENHSLTTAIKSTWHCSAVMTILVIALFNISWKSCCLAHQSEPHSLRLRWYYAGRHFHSIKIIAIHNHHLARQYRSVLFDATAITTMPRRTLLTNSVPSTWESPLFARITKRAWKSIIKATVSCLWLALYPSCLKGSSLSVWKSTSMTTTCFLQYGYGLLGGKSTTTILLAICQSSLQFIREANTFCLDFRKEFGLVSLPSCFQNWIGMVEEALCKWTCNVLFSDCLQAAIAADPFADSKTAASLLV